MGFPNCSRHLLALPLMVAPLASPSIGQQMIQPLRLQAPVRDAGVYHVTTGTWSRTGQTANLGPDVIYSATAPSGYFGTGWEGSVGIDEGILPGTGHVAGGPQDAYSICGFQFSYCCLDTTVDWSFRFLDGYSPCDLLSAPTGCIHEAGGEVLLQGLPGAGACWLVTVDLTGGLEVCLEADGGACAPGYQGGGSLLDHFGIAHTWTTPGGGTTGPVLAGYDPSWSVSGEGTCYNSASSCVPGASALGALDGFAMDDGTPSAGCYFFGGYDNPNGCGGPARTPGAQFYLELYADCAQTCAPCEPPTIVTQPAGGDRCPGGAITLTVLADQAVTYQWYKDDTALAGETGQSLTLTSLQEDDEANYHVVVTNACGESTQSALAFVRVIDPPKITQDPVGGGVFCTGATITLQVQATGDDIVYQWYRGKGIPVGGDSPTLTLTDAQVADSGDYWVTVSNDCSLAVSSPVNVEVCICSIGGRVTMGHEGFVMREVLVELLQNGSPVRSTTTDATGRYEFEDVDPGEYSIQATIAYTEEWKDNSGPLSKVPVNYPNRYNPDQTYEVELCQHTTVPVIRFPNPAVLLAGWTDSYWSLFKMDRYLAADPKTRPSKVANGIPAFVTHLVSRKEDLVGGFHNNHKSVEVHDKNGVVLRHAEEQILRPNLLEWLAPEAAASIDVSFLGFSAGGLGVRSYATRFAERPILYLVSLDTPHGGSAWADWGLSKFVHDSGDQPFGLHENHLNGTASNDGPEPDFDTGTKGWNLDRRDLKRPWYAFRATDTIWWIHVVDPEPSAFGLGRVRNEEVDGNWQSLTILDQQKLRRIWCDDDHVEIAQSKKRFREVGSLLAYGYQEGGKYGDPQSLPGGPQADEESTWGAAASAAAGAASSAVVPVDAAARLEVMLSVEGEGAAVDLVDGAGGSVVPPNAAVVVFGERTLISFALEPAPAGDLTLGVTAGVAQAAHASVALRSSNGRRLALTATGGLLQPLDPVTVLLQLQDDQGQPLAGTGASAAADVVRPDSGIDTVTLFDDGAHEDGAPGDGLFGGTYALTDLSGRYTVRASATASVAGDVVQRGASTALAVRSTRAAFSGPATFSTVDEDADGAFDALRLERAIQLTGDGAFALHAEWVDAGGALIALSRADLENDQGAIVWNASVELSALDLRRHGEDGPWSVRRLTVHDVDAGTVVADEELGLNPPNLTLSSFEWPPAPQPGVLYPEQGPAFERHDLVLGGAHLADVTLVEVGRVGVPGSWRPVPFTAGHPRSLSIALPALAFDAPLSPLLREGPTAFDLRVVSPWGTAEIPAAWVALPRE